MAHVTVEKGGGFVTVILDRPEAMNALSRALRAELCEAMAMERRRSLEWLAANSLDGMEERRRPVMSHGRKQS